MPVDKLKGFLNDQKVKYVTISHSLAYTAQEVAASAHIHGKNLAKTVIVKIDGDMAMAVLPANFKLNLKSLKAYEIISETAERMSQGLLVQMGGIALSTALENYPDRTKDLFTTDLNRPTGKRANRTTVPKNSPRHCPEGPGPVSVPRPTPCCAGRTRRRARHARP